ncbi:MAG: ABC transporter permease [Vicinamibacterales bacterium]
MDTLLQDVRYAARALARSPGFTAAALLTLAIGAGANATVFSFVNALLLRPAPVVADPSSLYSVFTSDFSSGPYGATSYPDFLSLQAEASSFSDLAAFAETAAVVRAGEATERVGAMAVSGELFEVLGIRPTIGRLVERSDAAPNAPPVAVVGHGLWQRLFGGDPAVVGAVVTVNGLPATVVGVAPPRFDGLNLGRLVELWTPLVGRAGGPAERGSRGLSIVGRLRDGRPSAAAQVEMDGIAASLARAYPETNMGTLRGPKRPRPMTLVRHSRLHPSFRGTVAMLGAVLMSAVGLVLLVACANVASLLLSRAAARSREIAIKLALGASRGRLLRQLLTESLLLGVAGGALGALFSLWTADVLPSFVPADQARLLDAHVDGRVLAFTALLSVVAGLLFGLAPALQAIRPGAQAVLKSDGSRSSDARAGVMRGALVLVQVALTFVLLVNSGLLVQSLSNALRGDLGFGTRDAVIASIDIPEAALDPAQGAIQLQRALDRVRALPGIETASLARTLPLAGSGRRGFRMEGYEPRPGEDTELNINVVEPQYFDTMRMPILEGRAFDRRDTGRSPGVAVVNDVLAERYFGGRALGRRMQDARGTDLEIVGVVRTAKHRSVQEPALPVVFYPLSQQYTPRLTLVARTAGDAAAYAGSVRRAVQETHPSLAVFRVMTLAAHLSEALGGERLTATLVSAAGALALALAVVGVYGVIAYGVVRRRREIGVRVALGARPFDVVRLIVAEGLRVTLGGIIAGTVAALGATRLVASLLYGVSPWDAGAFAGAAALLAVVALLAAWAPAQRAVRLDPVAALRQE